MHRAWSRGPIRPIVDETMVWTPDGYELYEVLACGHLHELIMDESGISNHQSRMCRSCIRDCRPPTWNVPDWSALESRSLNWYEEKIAIYQAPTMSPYPGYKFGSGPKGQLLSQMRSVYKLLRL